MKLSDASMDMSMITRTKDDKMSIIQQLKKSRLASKTNKIPIKNIEKEIPMNVNVIPSGTNEFEKFGLFPSLLDGLSLEGYHKPTPVQLKVIPRLLQEESIIMAAATGSGKTLAFVIPMIQALLLQEQQGFVRRSNRPRALVLVPTRELAEQILSVIKQLSHHVKLSSCSVLGGERYEIQKRALSRLVDVVVASPGRLLQHKLQHNVYFSNVEHVIIDEVDTMLTQGFGSDIRLVINLKCNNLMILSKYLELFYELFFQLIVLE